MANIPFNHLSIADGASQVSAATMQTVFDAVRAIVDKAQRGSNLLDANSVSESGIGPSGSLLENPNMNGITGTGMWGTYDGVNRPVNTFNYGALLQIVNSHGEVSQFYINNTSLAVYLRHYNGTSWEVTFGSDVNGWRKIFDSVSSGNAGQPSAPKPTNGIPAGGANAPGQEIAETITTASTIYYSGASNLTGTWRLSMITVNTSTGAVVAAYFGKVGSGMFTTNAAGQTTYYSAWRQS